MPAWQVKRVVRDQYHVAYWKVAGGEQSAERANPLAKRVHVSYDIKHSDMTYVVDPNGTIRHLFTGKNAATKATLLNAIRQAQGDQLPARWYALLRAFGHSRLAAGVPWGLAARFVQWWPAIWTRQSQFMKPAMTIWPTREDDRLKAIRAIPRQPRRRRRGAVSSTRTPRLLHPKLIQLG